MTTLFSEHWHLVKDVKPKLREAIDVFPRKLRGRSWVFLHDQKTQKFVRLTPEAWLVVSMMDGKCSVNDLWEKASISQQHLPKQHRFYDNAGYQVITQNDLVNLLSQLYSNDMLQTQHAADAIEMGKRFKKQRWNDIKQSFLNPISIKVPLFYPDNWFNRQKSLALFMYSSLGFLIWCIIVLPAIFLAGSHWQTLTENLSDRILSTSNLFILWCTYPIVKAIHEWAHGMAVKAWGGVVREMGLMFVMFMPIPYVDATYSYRFTSRWARVVVAATGVMAELLLGAIALYVWLNVESGLVRAFAYNVIIIAGVSSLLVNGNPLMRYDGYYVLTELIAIPNLAQRAKQYWVYLSDKYSFKSTEAKPPMGYAKERFWLLIYGLLSPIYRTIIIFGMIWLIAKKYFIVGVVMAIISAWLSFVMPIYKGLKHIYTGQSLMKNRPFAIRRLYIYLSLCLILLFAIPVPFYSVQQGVAWLPEDNIVRANATGILQSSDMKTGKIIHQGDTIATLSNIVLQQKYVNLQQQIDELRIKQRQVQVTDHQKYYELQSQIASLESQMRLIQQDTHALQIRATTSGSWYPKTINHAEGSYVRKGDIVGYVIPKHTNLVRVAVQQSEMDLIHRRLQGIQIKPASSIENSYTAKLIQETPRANFDLPTAALGINAGGHIVMDPTDVTGKKAVERVFDLQLQLTNNTLIHEKQPLSFNDRVYIRFDLGWLPIGWQWSIRIKQLFLKNFNV